MEISPTQPVNMKNCEYKSTDEFGRFNQPLGHNFLDRLKMKKQTVTLLFLSVFVVCSSARFIEVTNQCSQKILVRTLGNAGQNALGYRYLNQRESVKLSFKNGWSGRLWANKSPGATLFEIATNGGMDLDTYNLSIIDGYNLPMTVEPVGGTGECRQLECKNRDDCDAFRGPNDPGSSIDPISTCRGSNYRVTFCA